MERYINEAKGKEWTIEIVGTEVRTTIGKIGEKGVLGTRGLTTIELAEEKKAQLIREKLKAGFVKVQDPPAAAETEKTERAAT